MDYKRFYAQLFKPIEERIGPIDPETIMAIVGFDFGGPVSLRTVGHAREPFVTHVSCELAVRDGQRTGESGPFEVMLTCNDEGWARKILTRLAQMSFDSLFGHGHTIDIGPLAAADDPMQGLIVEEFARVPIDGRDYCILRVHGITRSELEFAMRFGAGDVLTGLMRSGLYPNTNVYRRESIVTTRLETA